MSYTVRIDGRAVEIASVEDAEARLRQLATEATRLLEGFTGRNAAAFIDRTARLQAISEAANELQTAIRMLSDNQFLAGMQKWAREVLGDRS